MVVISSPSVPTTTPIRKNYFAVQLLAATSNNDEDPIRRSKKDQGACNHWSGKDREKNKPPSAEAG